MRRMIFLNLPVADLDASTAFYEALGFARNDLLSGPGCRCLAVEDTFAIMLVTRERYAELLPAGTPVADPSRATAHVICLPAESRAEVEAITARAVAAGAGPWRPAHDGGFLFGTSFTDPDGHVLEVMWLDVAAAAQAAACTAAAHAA